MKMNLLESNVDSKVVQCIATADEISCGGFKASVDTEKYKNVCILDFDFDTSEAMRECFKKYHEKMGLPLYFHLSELDSQARILKDMGAVEVEDTEGVTIWWNDKDKRVLMYNP